MTKFMPGLLIIFFMLVVFSYGLSHQELIAFDTRFYFFAQEMLRDGPHWFPTTYHLSYPDYLSTSTFLIYVLSLVTGHLNKFTAVFPTIVMGSMTMLFTYSIGRLHDERLGLGAIFFLLFTLFFVKTIRTISLDMAIAAITTTTFYLFYSADYLQKKTRLLFFYPLILLGFAFRGPLGLIVPTSVMCCYLLMTKQTKRLLVHGALSFLMLLIATSMLFILAHFVGGESFVKSVWQSQVMGRLDNPYRPFYFYFIDSLGSFALPFPVAIFVMGGVFYYALRQQKFNQIEWLLCLLFCCSMLILLGLSVPDEKKVRYVLPMLPFCSIIAAYLVMSQKQAYFILLTKLLSWFCFIFPTLALIALNLFKYWNTSSPFVLDCLPLFLLFSFLQCLQFFLLFFTNKNASLWLLSVASFTFTLIIVFIFEPIQLQLDQAREIVIGIEQSRMADHANLVFYREGRDGLPIKYLINMPNYVEPSFTQNKQELDILRPPIYIVMSEEYQVDMMGDKRYKKITNGKLGHVNIVVYKKD